MALPSHEAGKGQQPWVLRADFELPVQALSTSLEDPNIVHL